jgi:hypothetical protein
VGGARDGVVCCGVVWRGGGGGDGGAGVSGKKKTVGRSISVRSTMIEALLTGTCVWSFWFCIAGT